MRTATPGKQPWSRAAIPTLFAALPAALFYGILFRRLVNLPILDDYDALLGFLNQMARQNGAAEKLSYFFAAQHNEYKLFFAHGAAWAQFALEGRVNFSQLCVLGESAMLALAIILWKMFLPTEKNPAKRLALFVPAAWLLFQLGTWETLNWAMASLENLWVIAFSLAAIRCLFGPSRKQFAAALILYALAVGASGNGFLLLPLGLLVLAARRRFARAAGWLAVSAVCAAAYAYHYNPMSSQSPSHGSVFSVLLHLRPDYAIAFAGNAGGGRRHVAVERRNLSLAGRIAPGALRLARTPRVRTAESADFLLRAVCAADRAGRGRLALGVRIDAEPGAALHDLRRAAGDFRVDRGCRGVCATPRRSARQQHSVPGDDSCGGGIFSLDGRDRIFEPGAARARSDPGNGGVREGADRGKRRTGAAVRARDGESDRISRAGARESK